jgi:hypothetical protein
MKAKKPKPVYSPKSPGICSVQLVPHEREMHVYPISAHELDSFKNRTSSLHLAFFGIGIGAAISLGGMLLKGEIKSDRVFATVAAATLLAAYVTIHSGIRAWLDYRCEKQAIEDIKSRGVEQDMQ